MGWLIDRSALDLCGLYGLVALVTALIALIWSVIDEIDVEIADYFDIEKKVYENIAPAFFIGIFWPVLLLVFLIAAVVWLFAQLMAAIILLIKSIGLFLFRRWQ